MLMSFLSRSEAAMKRRSSGELLLFQMSCFAEAMAQPCTNDTTLRWGVACQVVSHACVSFESSGFFHLSESEFHDLGVSLPYSSHVIELDLFATGLNADRVETLSSPGGLKHVLCLKASNNPRLHGEGLATYIGKCLGQ